jgi:hypothetical protein
MNRGTHQPAAIVAAAVVAGAICAAASAQVYRAVPLPPGERPVIFEGGPDTGDALEWTTIDSGGGRLSGGPFAVDGTVGQFDAALLSGPSEDFELQSGFWGPIEPLGCWANCDGSTQTPVLNVADFTCFLQKFSAGDPYANCDGSTQAPVLNVADFTCFLQKFAQGC